MAEVECPTCPTCGEPITTLIAGLCPRCLVGNALGGKTEFDAEGSDFSASGIVTEARPIGDSETSPGSIPRVSATTSGPARLEFLGEIGRGGMGIVLRGRDPELGRELAVKILREDLRNHPEMVRRFVEEAQIAGQLQHPGIVPVHELGTLDDERPYFTMKLVKGRTLSQLLADGASSEVDRARLLGIFEQVCQTVAYAHSHGVIHRDLKPSNVMVGSFGEVQVMDWGLAKVLPRGGLAKVLPRGEEFNDAPTTLSETSLAETVISTARSLADSDLSSAGSVLGTPSYMAPEQARGEVELVDERADVFALGSILCEILTDRPAFTGRGAIEIQRRSADGDLSGAWLRLDACQADAELLDLARDCLAPERNDRPRDARVVAERLTAYLAGVQERLRAAELARAAESAHAEEATRTALAAEAQARAERRANRLTTALAAAGVGVIVLLGGSAAWLQQQNANWSANTSRLVNVALAETLRREGEARGHAVNDPAGWDAALAEARRADDLIKQGRSDSALRGRVADVLAALIRQRNEAAARADQLRVDRKLMADLDAAHNGADLMAVVDRGYAAAFADAGLDVDRIEARALGEWVAKRPARAELVVYLDDWAHIRRWSKPRPGQHPDTDFVAAARVADPDPWRDQLRAAHKDPTALRALADDETGLEDQPAQSLVRLAVALKDEAGDWDRGSRVLHLSWRRFPNDFWTNLEMSRFLEFKMDASPGDRDKWNEDRIRFLMAAVASRPSSLHALSRLGDGLVERGRFDAALEVFRRASRLRPRTAPYTFLGQALFSQKKMNEAVAAFGESIRSNPDDADAHMDLGNVLRVQKKFAESVAELRKATSLQPENSVYQYYYGWSLEASGDREGAIAALHEAFRLESRRNVVGTAAYALAENLRLAGRVDDAIGVLKDVLHIKPEEFRANHELVKLLSLQGRWNEAMKLMVAVSEQDPTDPLNAAKLAALCLLAGDDAAYRLQSLAMLERFGGQPGAPTLYAVGMCALGTRPVEIERVSRLIEETYQRERAANPGSDHLGWTQLAMALVDYRSGRFGRAAALTRKLQGSGGRLEIESGIVLAMADYRLGDLASARLRFTPAAKAVRAAFECQSDWDLGWLDWVSCELLRREAETLLADDTVPTVIGGSADSPPSGVYWPLIDILLGAGRTNEAIVLIRESLLLHPNDPRAQAELGELLARKERWQEARAELEKAVALSPSDDFLGLEVATLHLYLGDDAAYRRDSQAMLERFGQTTGVPLARATKSCLLSPKPVELDRVAQIARRTFDTAKASWPKADHHGWIQFDWALAEYRSGHFENAAAQLKQCRQVRGSIGLQSDVLLAMTYQRMGLKDEASRLLASCGKVALDGVADFEGNWYDLMTFVLFRREAETLIRDPSR